MDNVTIHTDGGCRPNPGPGGWGAVLCFEDGRRLELSGAAERTTNNQMEITAATESLRALEKPSRVEIITDSKYVQNGITRWISGWRKKGWLTQSGDPVKNQEFWKALDREISRHVVRWSWTRGHSGDAGNERADALARAAIPSPSLPEGSPGDVHLFCAASLSGKMKTGGYGVVLRFDENRRELGGSLSDASANQMHLVAAVAGLGALTRSSRVHLYTSSDYARDGATRWTPGWKRRGWRTADDRPVRHVELWQQLESLQHQHRVSWHVIRREDGDPPIEMVRAKELSSDQVRAGAAAVSGREPGPAPASGRES